MKTIEQNMEEEIARVVMDEQPVPPPAAPKRKKKLTESTAAKVTALVVMTAVTAGGVLGAAFLYSAQVYTTSEQVFKQSMFENVAWGDGRSILLDVTWDGENRAAHLEEADRYCAERNIASAVVYDKAGTEIWRSGANTDADSAQALQDANTLRSLEEQLEQLMAG